MVTPVATVVIDARMVGPIPHGIARYVSLLAQGLANLRKTEALPYRPVFLHPSRTEFYGFETFPVKAPFLNPMELFEIPRALQTIGASLYHSPSLSSLWHSPCPHLVTIHDLNHLTYGNFSKKFYYQWVLRRFAQNAAQVLTVSKFSQKEIADWLGLPVGEIGIVYNAIEAPKALPDMPESLGLIPRKYFVSLTNPKPHKNTDLLLRAYAEFRKQSKSAPWPLVLPLSLPRPQEGVIELPNLEDSTSKAVLSQAGGLLSPSIYEGFGLPPVEAATLGVPIAVSDIPPHREGLEFIKENELLWVKPTDKDGWILAFEKLQSNEILAPSLDSKTRTLDYFSVQRIGQSMDRIYKTHLNQR